MLRRAMIPGSQPISCFRVIASLHGAEGEGLGSLRGDGGRAELKANGEPGPGCWRVGASIDQR